MLIFCAERLYFVRREFCFPASHREYSVKMNDMAIWTTDDYVFIESFSSERELDDLDKN